MTTNKAVYHCTCFSKYIDSKLKHFSKPSKKRKSTEVEKGRKLTHLSAESGKNLIYSVVGVAKRMLILISSLDMNISGNKINHEIESHETFNFKMDRNGH